MITRFDMDVEAEEEKRIAVIVQSILRFVQPEKIILFGSRARGRHHQYSDYDIALVGTSFDHRTERLLREYLDEQLGIFMVDLVNLSQTDDQFQRAVSRQGRVIYESG